MMGWIADQAIRFRKAIIAVFAIAFALTGAMALTLPINYDMTDYLPSNANSTAAMDVMEESFEAFPNASVMAAASNVTKALEIKEQLEAIDGVSEVLWLDDVVDVMEPLASQDQSTVETYYKDGYALYTVTVESGKEQDAVAAIYEVVGEDGAAIGNAVDQASQQELAVTESMSAIAILAPLLLVILILATRSWIEPLLYLACIGFSIVINLGIASTTGSMSFVTFAVAPILQLAVALDYAVFLSSAYTLAREKTDDCRAAIRQAMVSSSKPIFASVLVGIFAFAALAFMDFGIGPDMAWPLVRGVVVSYLAVTFLMPSLIVTFDRALQRTRHRKFLPSFKKLGNGIVAGRLPILLVIVALVVPSYFMQQANSFLYGTGDAQEGTRLARDTDAIEAVFGSQSTLALLVPSGNPVAEEALVNQIEGMAGVTDVIAYVTSVGSTIPAEYVGETAESFYSDGYARIVINVSTDTEGTAAFELVDQIREAADGYYGEGASLMCGQSANLYDIMETVTADNERVDLITLVAIFVVLLVIFRSIIIPVIAIVTIKSAIFLNMAFPFLTGDDLSFIGYMVVSVVMMGSAIDYGILLIDHYLEERRSLPKLDAMRAALPKAIPAMIVSAATLALCGFGLWTTSSTALVQALALMLFRGGIRAFVMSITLLPALLLLFDRLIPLLSLHVTFFEPGDAKVVDLESKSLETGAEATTEAKAPDFDTGLDASKALCASKDATPEGDRDTHEDER